MGCKTKTLAAQRGVWTANETDGTSFVPYFRLQTNAVRELRASVGLVATMGDLEIQAAVSYSNDGITWSSESVLGSAQSSVGWSYGAAYIAVDATYRLMRIGVRATNTSGTEILEAAAALRVELKEGA